MLHHPKDSSNMTDWYRKATVQPPPGMPNPLRLVHAQVSGTLSDATKLANHQLQPLLGI